jgi:formamidopyrimidine-DNA glycosylase
MMAELTQAEMDRLFTAVKSVLQAMVAQDGRDTETDLFGQPGSYKTVLSKNTVDKPCPACGAPIKKETYLGGSIYYCPGCQRL